MLECLGATHVGCFCLLEEELGVYMLKLGKTWLLLYGIHAISSRGSLETDPQVSELLTIKKVHATSSSCCKAKWYPGRWFSC